MDREINYSEERKELEILIDKFGLDAYGFTENIPDYINLIKEPFNDISCEQYAIGTNGLRHFIAALYPKLDILKDGDIALYYDENRGTVHVGLIQEDSSVVSKWGDSGPVLKHPVDMVPLSYGSRVFFRRIPEEELRNIRGKDLFDMIS